MMLRAKLFPVALLALFSTQSFSASNLERSFDGLNTQTERCMNVGLRAVDGIDDSWLLSLDDIQMKVVLVELRKAAMNRCVLDAEKDYVYELYLDSLANGDTQSLLNWFNFKKENLSDSYKNELVKIPKAEIKRLSMLPAFYFPFDAMATFEHINK